MKNFTNTRIASPNRTLPKNSSASSRWFYLAMSLLMLVLVTYGFSNTVGPDLLHTQRSRSIVILLTIHGAVFYFWMLLMVVQSALVRSRKIHLHRVLGWFGAADGALIVVMGLWATLHQPAPLALEMIGIVSLAGFSIPVVLAIVWRKQPKFHRRLLLIATAMLTNAGFARFPGTYLPQHLFYAGTDALIAIGIAHDLFTERRVHIVYRYALPLFLVAEIAVLIPAWHYLG